MDEEKANEIVEKILSGDVKIHKLAEILNNESDAAEVRRRYLERLYSARFDAIRNAAEKINLDDIAKRNTENLIGAVQVPLGFVELIVNNKKYPVFMATTEGRLVAGVNRGASAINKSGGAKTAIINNNMTRSVIIETDGAQQSLEASRYLNSNEGRELLKNEYSKITSHGSMLDVDVYPIGRLLFVRYSADTAAAMGMNMVTIASTNITKALIDKFAERGINMRMISESGNMCTDKKPAMINIIKGRGVSVVAEAVIKKEVIEQYFNVDAEAIREINYAKNYIGSSLAGSLGHNAHIANILASTFIAYGQDIAQIVDGVNAFDDVKAMDNGDLYISVYLPALEVGTFGGGTIREAQSELLKASGVYGADDDKGVTKQRLAELIASTALAGELNLLAAEAGNELSSAHASIKRGK